MSRYLGLLLAGFASFAFGASAYGQADLTFSGGNGTPLTVTLDQSLTYTILPGDSSSVEAPLFDFQNLGSIVSNPVSDGSSTLSFSINGGAPTQINYLAPGGGDLYAFNSGFPGIVAGETITLNAGSFTTSSDYAGEPPAAADGVYTYITDSSGNQLSTDGAVIGAPEPSTWALMIGGLGALFALRRARRNA